jgi:hypothetical protein
MVLQGSGRPSAAFVLSLVGGSLIFVSSAISIVWFTVGSEPFGVYAGMLGDYHGMMGNFGFGSGYLLGFSVLGPVCGVLVVAGSFMFNLRPLDHVTWGAIVLAFSVVSFVSMGGWFVGAVLGIVGGAVGIVWRSR